MRVLLALAAALALSGCQVDLEGAVCAVPNSIDQCPSGQRCGVDQRCSASPLMTCPARSGADLVVDPGAPAGAPEPTGARSPPACRFRSLDQALAAAAGVQGAVVRAMGGTADYRLTATLAIPAGVTLRGDEEPLDPSHHILSLEDPVATGVSLAEGATLSGFTVRNVSAPASAIGVDIACAGTAVARLSNVIIEAAGASSSLANGIRAGGACPVELDGVAVRGASAAGLLVARDAATSTLVATGAELDGNGEGVHITRGDVRLEWPVVTSNLGAGVNASFVGTDVLLTIEQGIIRGNGDTGVVVEGSQAGRFRLTATSICSNGAVTARGKSYTQRKVGGLYLFGNVPPELAVEGNALFGNGGDQLLVAGAGTDTWTLDGAAAGATACGAGANLFDGYAPPEGGTTYVGLFAANTAVTARWNAWRLSAPPLAGKDYASTATGSVTVGTIDQYCPAPVPAPTCD